MVNGTHISDFRIKEPKLGATFLYKGVKLKTVKGFCSGCYFLLNGCECHKYACNGDDRKDGEDVMFVENNFWKIFRKIKIKSKYDR